ncbi:MAG: phosphate signaling complex protein PhoU [Peptococcaceae bacterium]
MRARGTFEQELTDLQQDILRLASLTEETIYGAVQFLLQQDVAGANQIISGDVLIDKLTQEIEDKCIKLIATQQPIAHDLRLSITSLKFLVSLERMADYAVDIARATLYIYGYPLNRQLMEYTSKMSRVVQQMIKEALDAYVNNDAQRAREMCSLDDEVDFISAKIFQEAIRAMREKTQPQIVIPAVYFLLISRYLERIADHATNIGEEVIFLITGEKRELN